MKAQIKTWLKDNGLSRDWLAEQIGVSKRTVDNWLSSSIEIPVRSESQIRSLMEDAAKIADGLRTQIFSVECTLEQFRMFSRAALAAGQTLEDWCIANLDWCIANLEADAREYFRRASSRLQTLPAPDTEETA